jgi:hypothetical protein
LKRVAYLAIPGPQEPDGNRAALRPHVK